MILGIGVDVVDIARVARLLDRKRERAIAKLFSLEEAEYCRSKETSTRHYAARIAAKEAAYKALSGTDFARGIGWREIVVLNTEQGPPSLRLSGRAARRAKEMRVGRIHLTISHSDTTAVAMVVLESPD